VVQDRGGDAAGCGDIAAIGEHLFAICPEPMGAAFAETGSERRGPYRSVCR